MNWSRGRGTYLDVWNLIWCEMILAPQSPTVAKHSCPFGPRGPFTGFSWLTKNCFMFFLLRPLVHLFSVNVDAFRVHSFLVAFDLLGQPRSHGEADRFPRATFLPASCPSSGPAHWSSSLLSASEQLMDARTSHGCSRRSSRSTIVECCRCNNCVLCL